MEKNKEFNKDIIISIDEENEKCVDCGKEKPQKISINHGTFICNDCAEEHKKLGNNISYVRDTNDKIDKYLLNFIVFGSNKKFKHYLKENNYDESLSLSKKYLTLGVYYYRKNLKHKICGDILEEFKHEKFNDIIEEQENIFPEFENYKINVNNKEDPKSINEYLSKIKKGITKISTTVVKNVKHGAQVVKEKSKPISKKIIPGIKKGANIIGKFSLKTFNIIKNKIMKKGEHIKENENENNLPDKETLDIKVKNLSNKANNEENQNNNIDKKLENQEKKEEEEEKKEDKKEQNVEEQNEEKIDN